MEIILPSKPKIVSEEGLRGVYEIEGLYPGYGHTLGNSLRRIILSSLAGFAVTSVKIDGIEHEFSTIEGIKEDVITILLNIKRVHFRLSTDEPQEVHIDVKGPQTVTAANIKAPGQVEVLNPDQHIALITQKGAALSATMRVERGLGYVPKEVHHRDKVERGTITLDAVFTPIRRVNYEVENMRVGERTDYNRLRITIETNDSLSPREALEESITIMIKQLKAIVGFEEETAPSEELSEKVEEPDDEEPAEERRTEEEKEFLKTRVDTLGFSTRTANALSRANIRTVGGLARKSESDLLALEGMGEKGVQEIKRTLSNFGITLR